MDLTAARINHAMLANFINQRVIIIGKVLSTAPDMVQLETSDGGLISVIPSPGSDYSSTFVEVIGKVNKDQQVQEFVCTKCGENFDMKNYNQLVTLSNGPFKNLFV